MNTKTFLAALVYADPIRLAQVVEPGVSPQIFLDTQNLVPTANRTAHYPETQRAWIQPVRAV